MNGPEIVRDADLSGLSTFRLPARAAALAILEHPEQIAELPPADHGELVLGGGSNTVFVGNYPGIVLLNRLRGVSIHAIDDDRVLVTAAAGENWHLLVRRCLDAGIHGLENLAMIPGSVGAAPMQNIGAYGVELSDVFSHLTAWDRHQQVFIQMDRERCAFGYRDSRFKSVDRDRYLITSVTLKLSRHFTSNTGYASLHDALANTGVHHPTPRQLAATIMRLRRHRLPDPARLANAGSFFKNPVVCPDTARAILDDHPDLPHWAMPGGQIKLAAGHMIELLGWKGKSIGDAGVYPNHALVLVNRGQATAGDLLKLVDAITGSVENEFGVRLEPEPVLVGGN